MKKLKKLQKRASGADASGELARAPVALPSPPSRLSVAHKLHRPRCSHAVAHMLYQLMGSYTHACDQSTDIVLAPRRRAGLLPSTRRRGQAAGCQA